jgi:hypothetical protein
VASSVVLPTARPRVRGPQIRPIDAACVRQHTTSTPESTSRFRDRTRPPRSGSGGSGLHLPLPPERKLVAPDMLAGHALQRQRSQVAQEHDVTDLTRLVKDHPVLRIVRERTRVDEARCPGLADEERRDGKL